MTDPYYQDERVTLWHGDCLDVLRTLPDASVDSVVTDPPYGLEFMGKEWDAPWKAGADVHAEARTRRAAEVTPTGQAHSTSAGPYLAAGVNKYAAGLPFQQWCQLWAAECLRVLKPGGMIVAFGGTRTFHRLACAIEDAGFEIRDSIGYGTEERPGLLAWAYGSGFPKSLNVTKALGALPACSCGVASLSGEPERMVRCEACGGVRGKIPQGLGTALKPAWEPIVLARKPLAGGSTVAANVLAWGTGALNVDGCRVGAGLFVPGGGANLPSGGIMGRRNSGKPSTAGHTSGRWPANVVLDEHAAAELDRQSGESSSRVDKPRGAAHGEGWGMTATGAEYADTGGASRFFYVAKAPTSERPRYSKSVLRLRAGLTPEQVGHVRARLAEAGVRVD